jgi:hypothetical protein
MAPIVFERTVGLSSVQAWDRLTDFAGHSRFVPFTKVRLIDPAAPGGGGFIARTELAGIGFDDVNVLEIWTPPVGTEPGFCQLRKTGKLVGGWAKLTVTPGVEGSSQVRWQEAITLRGVPAAATPMINIAGTQMVRRIVSGVLR